ncbi:Oidioi.mRNA.OKI2018_I69.chr1.g1135.t1.cds [Oikopleura dioica]|uniref:Oidioi.mRNA.OKI2018_I69.chr1.g1135.t1.cds n=1 Tax=Oikopleura dioica TaxID=34765 RepID=A0ABN7STC5_OIKDI|nr:Oidioi.mRNA.OKI2018_I69.chr1.g1135.t1.cds [Oikopleura dioica]
MWVFLIFLSSCAEAQRAKIIRSCPDSDLGEKCEEFCWDEYLACVEARSTSACERLCMIPYADCSRTCPCYEDCPDGCENCPNTICSCRSPETDNVYFQQCMKEGSGRFNDCITSCTANTTCLHECSEVFQNESEYCPCMPKCPMGCSCKDGYKCQPYVTALCQNRPSNDITSFNYIISADGSFKETRHYQSPFNGTYPYLEWSGHAMLHGEHFFFGSRSDVSKKIAKLIGCTIQDSEKQLLQSFNGVDGSLVTITSGTDSVILCRGSSAHCESFDGESSRAISSTQINHRYACMAEYENVPIIIGGLSPSLTNKVEILSSSGWEYSTSHPNNIQRQTCLSIENGVLTIGGYLIDIGGLTKNVFLLRDDEWNFAGALQSFNDVGSSIHFGDFFLAFGGNNDYNYVEKAIWDGQNVTSSTIINEHEGKCYRPILFESSPDACNDGCHDFCYFYP